MIVTNAPGSQVDTLSRIVAAKRPYIFLNAITPEEFRRLAQDELNKHGRVVEAMGLKVESRARDPGRGSARQHLFHAHP